MSSIQSGCQMPQTKVDQTPRYENATKFQKRLKRGRPGKKEKRQYWVK